MHTMSDHLCIEYLDEKNKHVKSGELGRKVITDVNGYAIPLIRYDIGDIGTKSALECNGGVNLPIMDVI